MPTGDFLNIVLQNNSSSSDVYAHVTGLDINAGYGPIFIEADGSTVYRPASPSSILQPLQVDCAIAIGPPGSSRAVQVPQMAGARIWISTSGPLQFMLNPGPQIVEPSATNPSDPNYNLNWGFCEFTFNQYQLFVNISYVDFVGPPISLTLLSSSGSQTSVPGLPPGGLDLICDKLKKQDASDGAGWSKLVIRNLTNTANLRALSPNSGIVMNPGLFSGYYQPYVDAVWEKYGSETLTVDTQAAWGVVTGRVAADGTLAFASVGSFSQPAAKDIFSCSTGPFGGYTTNVDEMANIGARLAAAFNRSTLLINDQQPDDESVLSYYKVPITNHYARICHETTEDAKGYAFPYDDVGSSSTPDQSGSLSDGNPLLLTIGIGGLAQSSTKLMAKL